MISQSEKSKPKRSKMWLIYGLILLAVFAASLALRIGPMYNAVFGSGWFNLQGVDGVYHLRLVENLLQHFPFRISFDPYTYFPYGQTVYFAPLYDLLAGFCAWVAGLGSPTQHTIETVAAYFPAVMGALTVVPVYFIGKTLFNRTAGLIAAAVLGILPGTFLYRSRLGFFDHHVAEVFFSTLTIMFVLLAFKQVGEQPISFRDIRNKHWKAHSKPLLLAALGGVALGSYLVVWVGGLLFVFLLFCFFVVMFIVDHIRKHSTDYISILGIPVFLLAFIIVIPFLGQIAYSELYIVSLLIGLIVLILLPILSKIMDSKKVPRIYFPLSLLGIGVIGFIILYFGFPAIARSIIDKFNVFKPDENGLTISEVRPFLTLGGKFTLAPLWTEFTTGAIIAQ